MISGETVYGECLENPRTEGGIVNNMGLADRILPQISGVYAAMPTTFGVDGRVDPEAVDPVIEFLLGAGISGLCVGGATGEYPVCSIKEREILFRRVAKRSNGRVPLIFGIGAGNAAQVGYLAKVAHDCGGSAVLLPPPFYFRYNPEDVVEFIRNLGKGLPLPVLIYYIPQFTNPFDLRKALKLIEVTPNIVGIKDSSGMPENPVLFAAAKARTPMLYFSGDDSLLIDALLHGADGAISGVASACPEVLMAIEMIRRSGTGNYPDWLQKLLMEFILQIDSFPAPWGVKLALEARGFKLGPLSWTGSTQMNIRIEAFQKWFRAWLPVCLEACASSGSHAKHE
jgi:4-hydroxy-tetrahydrodipicolinate synthase